MSLDEGDQTLVKLRRDWTRINVGLVELVASTVQQGLDSGWPLTYLGTQVEVAEEDCGLGAGDDQDDEDEEEEAEHVVHLVRPDDTYTHTRFKEPIVNH